MAHEPTHDPRCAECGTTEFVYLDSDHDKARLLCPVGHEFPTAEPMTEAGRRADAERKAEPVTGTPGAFPEGEPDSVRRAAELQRTLCDFGARHGSMALNTALRVLNAFIRDEIGEDVAKDFMLQLADGEWREVRDRLGEAGRLEEDDESV